MTSRNLFCASVGLILLAIVLLFLNKDVMSPDKITEVNAAVSESPAIHQKISSEITAQSTLLKTAEKSNDVEKECKNFWVLLSKWDFARMLAPESIMLGLTNSENGILSPFPVMVEALRVAGATSSCSKLGGNSKMQQLHEVFLDSCSSINLAPSLMSKPTAPNRMPERVSNGIKCIQALSDYRLQTVRELNRNKQLNSIGDTSTLLAMMFGEVQAEDVNYKIIGPIANRILELDPKNKMAAEIFLRSKFLDWQKSDHSAQAEAELEVAERQLLNLDPSLSVLRELKLARVQETGSSTLLRTLALEESSVHPTSDIGAYYLAWASYLEGDVVEAKNKIASLVEINPANLRAKYTFDQMTNNEATGGNALPFFQEPAILIPTQITPNMYLEKSYSMQQEKPNS